MSSLLQYENQVEGAAARFFNTQGITATPARDATDLGSDSVQVIYDYNGALEDTRINRANVLEYDSHTGTLMVLVSTFRDSPTRHNERLGKIRALMLNGNHGLAANGYKFLDIQPLGASTTESEETNQDQTTLQYEVKFSVDLKAI